MVCRRREFWVSRNRRRRPGKNLKDLLSVWNVAVETVNNCVFEAFSLTGIFGVRHFLRESADFLTRKLPRAEVFADEFLHLSCSSFGNWRISLIISRALIRLKTNQYRRT